MSDKFECSKSFREWFADRLTDFARSIENGDDPEVTFSIKVKSMPRVTCQIRLIDMPGVFTREGIPLDIIQDGRDE